MLQRIKDEQDRLLSRINTMRGKVRGITGLSQSFSEMLGHYDEMIRIGVQKLEDFQSHHDYIEKVQADLNAQLDREELDEQIRSAERRTEELKKKREELYNKPHITYEEGDGSTSSNWSEESNG